MELHDYQWEVIGPALEGKNIIIWLPTGAGKTRAALYVAMRHLEMKRNAKVCLMVNKVHLVDQHFSNEFHPHLKDKYKVVAISGDTEHKCFFAELVQNNDVIICTAQILQNALSSSSEEIHVELTDFTLLIIDECHHTHKDGVYNKLMEGYLERKITQKGKLPQILGLTASPGTGRATSFEKAEEHILQICANLDTWRIMSAEVHREDLEAKAKQPNKQYDLVTERPRDPFGDKLKELMKTIHEYLRTTDFCESDFGTQLYEQKVVELEKEGAVEANRMKRTCALHLRKYNDSLLVHDTVRMMDAYELLDDYYQQEKVIRKQNDPTDAFLIQLFDGNRARLLELAQDVRFENPKLRKLEEILRDQFQFSSGSRGIIFTRTRQSTHSLHNWISSKHSFQIMGVKTAPLTGAGYSNQSKHMTQNEQRETIEMFRKGQLNLLISTSVAEEGLDIPQCNIVVRYGLMTNEISMVQARGRARHEDSCYSFLAKIGGKEIRREETNETLEGLMKRAIEAVQRMPEQEYQKKIKELQEESVIARKVKQAKRDQKRNTFYPEQVRFYCRCCSQAVAHGDDFRTIEGTHYVNINSDFRIYYEVCSPPLDFGKKMVDWTPGGKIRCLCGQDWGFEMIYKHVNFPAISVKNFVVETPEIKRPYARWKDVPFPVDELNYVQHVRIHPELLVHFED
ncbi:DEXH-box helicase 58 L homeolog [Xenopus laevis]|uniref:RNA helicase n=1 Tax=Xenopus laevis TaxID=8355 RepID=Q6GNI3_XENLA|nr:DEXH-box helicase 58 L homeolog [Xenopus laevis]AAH73528.1 MGC82787 protein [Xenopus laevis]